MKSSSHHHPPMHPPICKNEPWICCLKMIESVNTRRISRPPHPHSMWMSFGLCHLVTFQKEFFKIVHEEIGVKGEGFYFFLSHVCLICSTK